VQAAQIAKDDLGFQNKTEAHILLMNIEDQKYEIDKLIYQIRHEAKLL